jgi:hypothetical protein
VAGRDEIITAMERRVTDLVAGTLGGDPDPA